LFELLENEKMKRRKFIESSLILGGAAAAPAGLAAGMKVAQPCDDTGAVGHSFAAYTRLGVIQPKSSDQITDSYWGIQAGAFDDKTLAMAKAIGVKWTRIIMGWDGIEKQKGQFDWSRMDATLDALLKFGITPFVTLSRGNPLYTGIGRYDDPKLAAIYGDSPAPPLDDAGHAAWLVFVEKAIKRYMDRIRHWEVWNEPNHRKYWGAPPDGEDYGKLVRITVRKIRSLYPEAKIIAGSTAGIRPEFFDTFLAHCEPELIDVMSFHNYGARPENRAYRMEAFKKVLDKYNPDFEIWQGECGIASQSRTTGYRGTGPWGHNIQAKWLLRQSFVDTWFCQATLSNYFKLFDEGSPAPGPTKRELTDLDKRFGAPERNGSRMHAEGINQKCILSAGSGEPKPAYFAYQNLCAAMDSRYRRADPKYRFRVTDTGHFYGIGEFEDAFPSVPLLASYVSANPAFLAYSLPWFPQEEVAKYATVSLQVKAGFREPVLLDLLTGNVYVLEQFETASGKTTFEQLPLADYPMVIAERSELTVKS
jgi:hypothetical protein